MKTSPCVDCGEPTRVFVYREADSVVCEDCSGDKVSLMDFTRTAHDRTRRGLDPALADRRYDGVF
jgi:hypothetical protein